MGESNRRYENRISWRGSVQIVLPGSAPIEATIADISETGCGLKVDHPVQPGTEAEIHGNGFEGEGVIRHCYPHEGGFHLGVELKPVC